MAINPDNSATPTPASTWEKRKRPNGLDLNRYEGLESWSYRRWAWEFLRRNPDFIKACKSIELEGTDEEKQEIALKFGLKKFKSYREGYESNLGTPIFSSGSISSISNLENSNGSVITKRVKISSGEILIRFDLNLAVEDKQAFEKQLRLAKLHLQKKLLTFSENHSKKIIEHKHPVNTFGIYLRLLDLRAAGKTYSACARALCNEYDQLPDHEKRASAELPGLVSKRIKRAFEYANHLYQHLAHLNTIPNTNGIPLEIRLSSANE